MPLSHSATYQELGYECDLHIRERNLDTHLSVEEGGIELDFKVVSACNAFAAVPSVCLWLSCGKASLTNNHREHDVLLDAMSAFDGLFVLVWMWSAGSFLNSVLQPVSKFNLSIFRTALAITALYPFLASDRFTKYHSPVYSMSIPLHLLGWLCAFYVINQVSKALVLAETGNVTSFFDYALEFLLIWVFPVIGVWFIQPRINRLYSKSSYGLAAGNTPIHGAIDAPR
jgi:hypothetical protein